MSSKHRVRISGTIGKSIRVGEARPIMGINVDHPAGGTPTLEQWKEIFCCAPPAPPNPIWQWPNLADLARLDCCGIIVRVCEADIPGSVSYVYDAAAFGKLYNTEVVKYINDGASARFYKSTVREGAHTRISALHHKAGGTWLAQFDVGGQLHWRMHSRLVDDTGAVLSSVDTDIPKWGTGSETAYNGAVVRNTVGVAGIAWNDGGASPGRWVANGEVGDTNVEFPHSVTSALSDTGIGSLGKTHYASGAVFLITRGSEDAFNCCIARYAAGSNASMPSSSPSAVSPNLPGLSLVNGFILGDDGEGSIFVGDYESNQWPAESPSLRVWKLSNTLEIQREWWWTPTINYSGMGYSNVAIIGGGRYLVHFDIAGGTSAKLLRIVDLQPATPVEVAAAAIDDLEAGPVYPTHMTAIDGATIYISDRDSAWTVLDTVVEADIPGGDSFECRELVAAGGDNSRIVIVDGDGQAGDPTFDLRVIEQEAGGTLQAVTVDDWGRVIASRPASTADIEAIFTGTISQPDAGAAPDAVADFDGGDSLATYTGVTMRYGDEGDSTVQYGVGVADFDERGAAGSVTGIEEPGGTPPDPDSWSPLNLSPEMWLDASDATSVELVGSNVERWLDKSGRGNHCIPPGAAGTVAPTRGAGEHGQSIIFGGAGTASPLRTPLMAQPNPGDGLSVFVVAKQRLPDTIAGPTAKFLLSQGSANLYWKLIWRHPDAASASFDNACQWNLKRTSGYGTSLATNIIAVDALPEPRRASIWSGDISTAVQRQFLDGTAAGTPGGTETRPLGTWGYLYLGDVQPYGTTLPDTLLGPYFFDGEVYEVVLVHGVVSEANRQRLEGYLAHKHGLEDNLPGDHPFKAAPPT